VTGGSTQQSQMRLPNCLTSRSEGRSQGRPQPAFIVRESLRACRSEGSSCDRSGLIQLAARVRFDGGNSRYNARPRISGTNYGSHYIYCIDCHRKSAASNSKTSADTLSLYGAIA
jgi:hypothetical protein